MARGLKYVFTLILCFECLAMNGQKLYFHLLQEDSIKFRPYSIILDNTENNPAYLSKDGVYRPQTIIQTNFKHKSDAKLYDVLSGKSHTNYNISTIWLKDINSKSSFCGIASFAVGSKRDVKWNTIKSYDEYGPYILVNEKGGNFQYQQYFFSAIYNYKVEHFSWGVNFNYKGDYAHKDIDPRAKDIASWLGIKSGFIINFSPQHEIGVALKYQIHKQNIDIDIWNSNKKQLFSLLRGFGQYDHVHSEYLFSKKRMYLQNNLGTYISGSLWKNKDINIDFSINGNYKKIKTEEESTINLHELTTTIIRPKIYIHNKLNDQWSTGLFFERSRCKLMGKENRYSYKIINNNFGGVYDYIKIGSITPFYQNSHQSSIQWDIEHSLLNKKKLGIATYYSFQDWEEYYKGTQFYSFIQKHIPGIKGYFSKQTDKYNINLLLDIDKEFLHNAENLKETQTENLYNKIYLPFFLYKKAERINVTTQIDYKYIFSNEYSLGAILNIAYASSLHTKTVYLNGCLYFQF